MKCDITKRARGVNRNFTAKSLTKACMSSDISIHGTICKFSRLESVIWQSSTKKNVHPVDIDREEAKFYANFFRNSILWHARDVTFNGGTFLAQRSSSFHWNVLKNKLSSLDYLSILLLMPSGIFHEYNRNNISLLRTVCNVISILCISFSALLSRTLIFIRFKFRMRRKMKEFCWKLCNAI